MALTAAVGRAWPSPGRYRPPKGSVICGGDGGVLVMSCRASYEGCWLGQRRLVGEELQASGLVHGGQSFQEQA